MSAPGKLVPFLATAPRRARYSLASGRRLRRRGSCKLSCHAALLPVLAPAQVSLFTQGPGLLPEDNRLLFESIARLNAAKAAPCREF